MPICSGPLKVPALAFRRAPRLLGTVALFAGFVVSASAQPLNDAVNQAIAAAKVGPARVGVSIVDLSTGRVLAARDEAEAFIPASNMKLVTSGAALVVLGDSFTFRTEFRRDGDRLVIVGGGDPALADPELLGRLSPPQTVDDVVGRIVGAVADSGMRSVTEVVIDDRVFDTQFVHPTWPVDQLNRWYCAEVSGINFHTNTLSVFPRPGREGPGRPPEVATEPDCPWIAITTSTAKTVASGATTVYLTRASDANRFELRGQVAAAVKEPVAVTLHDPAIFFGELLADRLGARGITTGPVRRASDGDGEGGELLAVATTHIDDVLARCNTDSYNLYAEALLKRLGHEVSGEPGSWSNGAAVVRMTLSQLIGPQAAAGAVIADGSGMSRDNRVTPRLMTAWLGAILKRPGVGGSFMASLAGPGESTLRSRFAKSAPENQLSAKTGYIRGVRCLSGVLTNPSSGRQVAFSILVNDLKGEFDQAGKRLHESIVLVADQWLSEQSAERAGADDR